MATLRKIDSVSKLTTIMFIVLLSIAIVISDFFQRPKSLSTTLDQARPFIKTNIVSQIDHLKINNSMGSFELNKVNKKWELTIPGPYRSNKNTVKIVLDLLNSIQILKVLPKDPINLTNYSLDTPHLSIDINSPEITDTIDFGLINPIDRTSYIASTRDNAIYQVRQLNRKVGVLDLSSFIDSHLFPYKESEVTKIKVKSYLGINYTIVKSSKGWKYERGRTINPLRVEKFFSKIENFRSQMIIDNTTNEQDKEITKLLSRRITEVSINLLSGSEKLFKISSPIRKLKGIPIENRKSVLMLGDDNRLYLASRDLLNIFSNRP